ncbi:hypothetical protein [Streptomyces microflavus]|uniref:hypothetical protein n=2 Tax=Streptomyces microflavus TaxID=1919 RepID=UPI003B21B777
MPTYDGGAQAPTVTGLPDFKAKKIRWYQHYDVDESARALANKLGGVETNTANVFQIELVGTCDDKYAKTWSGKTAGVDYIYWPDAPEWALAEVAWLVRWLHDNHGVPLTCVKDWLSYGKDSRRSGITPASYGASPARMSMAAWQTFTGWCGHQHVPENDHGDPGSMDFARVIALAKGSAKPTAPAKPAATPEEDDRMPDLLTESSDTDTEVPAGEWSLLAMAKDSALLQGPCSYTVTAYATVIGTSGTRVEGRYHDLTVATKRTSLDLPMDAGVIGPDGRLDVALTRPGRLASGVQLRLELLASAPVTVTYRVLRGLVWRN